MDQFAPSTTTFEPTPDDVNAATSAYDQPTGELDLNDPKFASEDIGVNPEGDAYAVPPPVPDGKYRAKLKLLDVEDNKGNKTRYAPWASQDGSKVALFTKIEATVQDPSGKYDGLKVFDSWFSTMLNRDGSTKVSTLLSKLGKLPAVKSHKALMDALVGALAAEPDIFINTQWEASCQTCSEEFKKGGKQGVKPAGAKGVRGMRHFAQKADGTHDPEIVCPTDAKHGVMVAQARIAGFEKL